MKENSFTKCELTEWLLTLEHLVSPLFKFLFILVCDFFQMIHNNHMGHFNMWPVRLPTTSSLYYSMTFCHMGWKTSQIEHMDKLCVHIILVSEVDISDDNETKLWMVLLLLLNFITSQLYSMLVSYLARCIVLSKLASNTIQSE